MFTPFQKAMLALVAVGFLALSLVTWMKGPAASATGSEPVVRTAPAAQTTLQSQNAPAPGIVTVGEASVQAVPNEGYLAFAVQVGGPVGTDIAGQLQTRVESLLAKARGLGVDEGDIILGPLQFQPQFSYDQSKGGPQVISYNAYQQIAIECDEIGGMPVLIQELMKDKAISALSVKYAVGRDSPAYRIARENAIADARAQAEVAAAKAGLKLGSAISITDIRPQTSPYGAPPVGSKFPTVGGPGFPPAAIDTVIQVQVQFAVEPLT